MTKTRMFGVVILLFSLSLVTTSSSFAQTRPERFTDKTLARNVGVEFMTRMQQTRDLATLRDLYVDDFISRSLKAFDGSLPDVGSTPSFSRELASQLNPVEWERYYFAQVNLRYSMVLYLASSLSPSQVRSIEKGETAMANLLPAEVVSVLNSRPFPLLDRGASDSVGSREIATTEEFRSVIAVLEKATTMMREHFKTNPPEQTRWYRQNVGESPASESTQEPYLSIDTHERYGFQPGTHFYQVITKPALFELTLVKIDTKVKIVWARVYPFN